MSQSSPAINRDVKLKMGALSVIVEFLFGILLAIYYVFESLVLFLLPTSWRAKDVSRDIVLITGGGSGLGRLMAIQFAKLGSIVVVWDIDAVGNAETVRQVKEAGGRAHPYICDISKRESIYETAKRVRDQVGIVTILVNNAGIVIGKSLLEVPDAAIEKIFAVNILAHFWTTKAFLPGMFDQGRGHIVTIASMAGHIGNAKMVDYCSTKFAAVGFDDALHAELKAAGRHGIHTTCVCPFFISTGMFDGVHSKVVPQLSPEYVVTEIVRAVLVNQDVLMLPRIFYPISILKSMFCRKANDSVSQALGAYSMMDQFRGHPSSKGTTSHDHSAAHEE